MAHIQKATEKAYVLWLIRERAANTWNQLCSHFQLAPRFHATGQSTLLNSIQALVRTQLLEPHVMGVASATPDGINPTRYLLDVATATLDSISVNGDSQLRVSPLCDQIHNVLGVSLRALAMSDPAQRLVVTPLLSQVSSSRSSRYRSDIFVLMPFEEAMRAVYDDHIKPMAKRLGMSVARVDDFFSSAWIMSEIWTAILNARLIIADCTGRNPNVFYEIGLAHAQRDSSDNAGR